MYSRNKLGCVIILLSLCKAALKQSFIVKGAIQKKKRLDLTHQVQFISHTYRDVHLNKILD